MYTAVQKINQDNDSVFAVLDKVASFDDKEEVARLAWEAKGRKLSVRITSCSLILLLCRILSVARKGNVPTPTPSLCQVTQIFWQKFIRISKNSHL